MAKKKGLRRRLLGSTKTGRLVRAASLAGVLGGGGYLASRSVKSSRRPSSISLGELRPGSSSPTQSATKGASQSLNTTKQPETTAPKPKWVPSGKKRARKTSAKPPNIGRRKQASLALNPSPTSPSPSVAQRKKNAYQLIKGTNRRLARAENRIRRGVAQSTIADINKENTGRWGLITRANKPIKNRRDAVDVPMYRERLRRNQEVRSAAEARLKSLPKQPKTRRVIK